LRARAPHRGGLLAAALVALGAAAVRAESPRQAGDALRERLGAAGLREELAGTVRLAVRLGGARVGSLVLRTELAERSDGTPVYRLTDRLDVELPGRGALHMLVRADLRADLSAASVVLETEEPRGAGVVSRQRVTLDAEEGGWVRRVFRGQAAPSRSEPALPLDALVLTPPLGAGERLARLAEATLGRRYSVRGLDLETGSGATWRLSIDDRATVRHEEEGELAAVVGVRQEGAARLELVRDQGSGRPWRIDGDGRLAFVDPDLAGDPLPATPAGVVCALLRACARGDGDAVRARLDLDALWAAAGGDAADPEARARFEAALVDLVTDPEWLRARSRGLAFRGVVPSDLQVEPAGEGRSRVSPRGAPEAAFVVAAGPEGPRVVDLPR